LECTGKSFISTSNRFQSICGEYWYTRSCIVCKT
jgi:hypothetical protein